MNIFNQGVSLYVAKKQYGAHMPVLYTNDDEWTLSQLVTIHGLNSVADKKFAIEGIAIDLGITTEAALKLLIDAGYIDNKIVD